MTVELEKDDWPSHSAELGRKSLTAVERVMKAFNAGKITKRECALVIRFIWETIAGLAPKEDLRVIEAVLEELKSGKANN